MNITERNIKEITENAVANSGYFLIDLIIRGFAKNRVIEVFIDGKDYINADDCSQISREINDRLQNIIEPDENYRLDVSSPGTDRPLKYIEQFPKHITKKFDLSYKQGNDTKKVIAKLIDVYNDELKFLTHDNKEMIIKFKDIVTAKVLLSFS
jgi:ribosome maturation factor RimP